MILSKSLSQVCFTPSAPHPPPRAALKSSQQTAATVSTQVCTGLLSPPPTALEAMIFISSPVKWE